MRSRIQPIDGQEKELWLMRLPQCSKESDKEKRKNILENNSSIRFCVLYLELLSSQKACLLKNKNISEALFVGAHILSASLPTANMILFSMKLGIGRFLLDNRAIFLSSVATICDALKPTPDTLGNIFNVGLRFTISFSMFVSMFVSMLHILEKGHVLSKCVIGVLCGMLLLKDIISTTHFFIKEPSGLLFNLGGLILYHADTPFPEY